MNFLFITNTSRIQNCFLDPSVRYRCYNTAFDLQQRRHIADVCHMKTLTSDLISNYDVFIFHRPSFSRKLKKIYSLIEKKNKLLIADYDDLIFDEKYAPVSPQVLNNKASLKIVLSIAKENHKALKLFNNFTVSTTPLKNHILELLPSASVKIVYNGLSETWLSHAKIYETIADSKIISYMSGTSSHDMDLPEFQKPLEQFLIENPDFMFEPVGPVKVSSSISDKQICKKEAVDFFKLSELIKKSWVTIAPLQKTAFNNCKSSIKFLESAAFGVPVLSSPIPDMKRFKDAGLIICNSIEEFYCGLIKLKDADNYKSVASQGREYVREYALSSTQTCVFLKFVNHIACCGN